MPVNRKVFLSEGSRDLDAETKALWCFPILDLPYFSALTVLEGSFKTKAAIFSLRLKFYFKPGNVEQT